MIKITVECERDVNLTEELLALQNKATDVIQEMKEVEAETRDITKMIYLEKLKAIHEEVRPVCEAWKQLPDEMKEGDMLSLLIPLETSGGCYVHIGYRGLGFTSNGRVVKSTIDDLISKAEDSNFEYQRDYEATIIENWNTNKMTEKIVNRYKEYIEKQINLQKRRAKDRRQELDRLIND